MTKTLVSRSLNERPKIRNTAANHVGEDLRKMKCWKKTYLLATKFKRVASVHICPTVQRNGFKNTHSNDDCQTPKWRGHLKKKNLKNPLSIGIVVLKLSCTPF